MVTQRAVLTDQYDTTLAGEPFDPSRARNAIYRQDWLTAQVRSALHQDRRPHLMRNDQEALYSCIALIMKAIPVDRDNANNNIWPRLMGDINSSDVTRSAFINHLRSNRDQIVFHGNEGISFFFCQCDADNV